MRELKLIRVLIAAMAENAYIFYDEASKEGVVIDPGGDPEKIADALDRNGIAPRAILLTHGHCDHIGAVPELRARYGVPVVAGKDEAPFLLNPEYNMTARFGRPVSLAPDAEVSGGDALDYAGIRLAVIDTPGHTPGGCCYYCESAKILFSGDTLFLNSVGRTDFFMGDFNKLKDGIKNKLFVLPGDVAVYPGHGDATTINREKKSNPFIR